MSFQLLGFYCRVLGRSLKNYPYGVLYDKLGLQGFGFRDKGIYKGFYRLMIFKSCSILRTLVHGNYDRFLILGNAGFISSTEFLWVSQNKALKMMLQVCTQRTQYPIIKEYTLNHHMKAL